MPKPNKGEKVKDFISRCVEQVMKDGTTKDNKQAVAICYSIYRESNKKKEKGVSVGYLKSLEQKK